MRKKKHLDDRLEACSSLLTEAGEEKQGKWSDFFASRRSDGRGDLPVRAEIGCGKGAFAVGMAQKYPDVNFVAVERVPDVIMLATEKAKASGVENLIFILGDASGVTGSFGDGEIEKVYLNFSDPWPKKRHAKRRLTAPPFLALYERILKPGGELVMKTDNDGLFDFSLEQLDLCGWRLIGSERDLHAKAQREDDVMTEYESNFVSQGKNINRLVAVPPEKTE
ncbi:MAG: tRNA (guanosine(46)-N7)-methyltransferase TrmB [Clostridia bacterium]|nr:tRNA (guanosine(46)-N7)-methyltransferase TrmB [Clostridia bacterium]